MGPAQSGNLADAFPAKVAARGEPASRFEAGQREKPRTTRNKENQAGESLLAGRIGITR